MKSLESAANFVSSDAAGTWRVYATWFVGALGDGLHGKCGRGVAGRRLHVGRGRPKVRSGVRSAGVMVQRANRYGSTAGARTSVGSRYGTGTSTLARAMRISVCRRPEKQTL